MIIVRCACYSQIVLTLKAFLANAGCEVDLAKLMGVVIPEAVKKIRLAIIAQGGELAGSTNASGEAQLALDVQANAIAVEELKKSGLVTKLASEEMESIVETSSAKPDGFLVVFDPLDGSSLVDVNFAVGSIFGVYKWSRELIQPMGEITGDDQIAACYAVYGPHTTLVVTIKKGTHEFRLADDGNFYLTKENLQISPEAKYFAPGNLRAAGEREEYLKLTNEWTKKALTLRYSGGMVPDINHILLKGSGIFSYPGYSKVPEGKLRLLFECNPMALLVEQAGGVANDGTKRVLAKKIMQLHERTPIYIGSKNAVEQCVKILK